MVVAVPVVLLYHVRSRGARFSGGRGASFSMKEALKRELCSRYVHGTSGRHFETDFPDQVVECLANGKVELIQRAGAGQGEQTISGIGVDHAGG